ncbi:probable palmitoyltransferase ZDHHC24 [Littorina saxatilis]|uniref:probable palmitoyltransferase ZDHHC24 n=1 Tax=Littorina saxatilis TaxID=31220 RepID=UPI0038B6274A
MQTIMLTLQSAAHRWLHKTVLGDQISMCVFFFGGFFLLWYELCHIASNFHTEWTVNYTLNVVLAIFVAVNIYSNWLMVFLTDVAGKEIVFPTGSAPEGWYYCDGCVANRPPRAHHCPLCKVCILKHDHHCWFAGSCIGYANHRYFFALVIHMTVAAIYCNIYNWSFVWSVKGDISFFNIVSFLLPHVAAVMGQETWYSFFITTLSMVGFALAVIFSWLLQIQVVQILHGQTRYERKKGITQYDQGVWANLEEVLGHHKFLVLLCPWLPSRLPGDGVRFYSQQQKAN